jgi:CheY-like chemotaxis protein
LVKDRLFEFFVSDTGIGIAPVNHQLIFERFRQADIADASKYGGTGLGLSISKALVQLLGGELWVKSELGQGATFYFSVPVRSVIDKSGQQNSPLLKYNWSKKTILIAEDEETNFLYIEELLAVTNITIMRVHNGAEAVEYCRNHPEVDLLLMDIKMPFMDGYTATRLVKQMRPNLPVVAQTAFFMSDDRTKALEAGFDEYISKPIDKSLLFKCLETLIKGRGISV